MGQAFLHGMTPVNRAKLRGERPTGGREKRRDRVNAGRRRGRDRGKEATTKRKEKKRGKRARWWPRERRNTGGEEGGRRERKKKKERGEKRMVRVPRGEVLGLACPGMASSHSRAFAVRGHHRARATLGFSTFSPRCLPTLRSKTASLKTFANSERATNRERRASPDFTGREGTVRGTRPRG